MRYSSQEILRIEIPKVGAFCCAESLGGMHILSPCKPEMSGEARYGIYTAHFSAYCDVLDTIGATELDTMP
jgi:hypothetical protein